MAVAARKANKSTPTRNAARKAAPNSPQFDKDQDLSLLRSGMSATVEIDTHHSRLPFSAQASEK